MAALRTATRAFNALGFGLVLVALIAIVPYELGQFTAASAAAGFPGLACPCRVQPRDRLPAAARHLGPRLRPVRLRESLRLNYGIEEQLTPWLADRGFHVTPDAHANYQRTSLSLMSSLNLDYLDAIPKGLT